MERHVALRELVRPGGHGVIEVAESHVLGVALGGKVIEVGGGARREAAGDELGSDVHSSHPAVGITLQGLCGGKDFRNSLRSSSSLRRRSVRQAS